MKTFPKNHFFDVKLTSGFTPKIILSLFFCLLMLSYTKGEKIDKSHLRPAENIAPMSDCSITAICVANLNISLDQFGNAILAPEAVDAGSSSDCGEVTLSVSPSTFDCDDVGDTIVVFLTVTDEEGNTNQCWSNVLVEDKFPPSVTCYGQVNVSLGTSGTVTLTPEMIVADADDNCDLTYDISPSDFDCSDVGNNTTVVVTVTDAGGNTSQCFSNVLIEDKFPPSVTCYGQVNVSLGASGTVTLTPEMIVANADDNCDLTYDISPSDFDCSDVGNNTTVVVTVTDAGGNTSQCFSNVLIEDKFPPSVTCYGQVNVSLGASGTVTLTPEMIVANADDNCDLTYDISPSDFDCSDVGNNTTVVVTVTDAGGNTSQCFSSVLIEDKLAPTAICNALVNISLGVDGTATITPDVIDAGSDDNCGDVSLSLSQSTFDCSDIGENIVIVMTVTDESGNTNQCLTNVVIEDKLAPTAICHAQVNISLGVDGTATITPDVIDAGSDDNCGPLTFSLSQSTFDCTDIGDSITVILTVTDGSGNTNVCWTDIVVEDKLAPTVTCPADLTLDCADGDDLDPSITGYPMVEDNCDAIGYSYEDLVIELGGPNFKVLREWVVVDWYSLTFDTCYQIIKVFDTSPPDIICVNQLTAALDNSGSLSIPAEEFILESSDDCGTLTLELSQTEFDCSDLGDNNLIITAYDDSENQSQCFVVLTIVDYKSPIAFCNSQVNISLGADGTATITPEVIDAGSYDECGPITLSLSQSNFDCTDIGDSITVILTVTDGSGNTSECWSEIIVEDKLAPTVTCPADLTLDCADGDDLDPSITGYPMVEDNCDAIGYSYEDLVIELGGPNFKVLREWVVVDWYSLTFDTCYQIIKVFDTSPPDIICVNQLTAALDNSGSLSIPAEEFILESSDDCGTLTLELSQTEFDCSDLGDNNLIITAYDDSENQSQCFVVLTIVDYKSPIAFCNSQVNISLGADGTATITPEVIDAGSYDECGPVTLSLSQSNFDCTDIGDSITVILTVTDGSGNTSECWSEIIVEDKLAPTVTCPADLTLDCSEGDNLDPAITGFPTVVDNCDFIGTAYEDLILQLGGPNFKVLRTWTVVDFYSNSTDTCYQIIKVIDSTPPDIACVNQLTVTLDETGSLTLSAEDFDAGTTDDCGIVTLSISQDQFDCLDIGNSAIIVTATDDSGNQSQCISDLTIVGLDADGDGYSICNGDCDDNDASTYPNAPEACGDNIDNNCNGEVDENCICASYGASTQNEWIESISAGGTANNTGDDGGYGDYSSFILNLNQGSNAIELTPGFSGGKRKEAWRIWIDFNQNGIYENSEKVFEKISKNPIVSAFDIPLTAQLGITSMRVSMKFNQYAEPCEIFAEGEVEDYSVNISGTSFCSSQGQSTQYEWINKVKLKSINNSSGNDNGYGDYTSLSTNLNPGQNKNINLNPGFSGSSYLEYWRVWVDWNEDGDFDDAGELEVEVASSGNVTDQITVPANASGGNKLMRVSMKYGGYPNPCETFTYGEVEDYTIFITGSNPLVSNDVPNNFFSSSVKQSDIISDDMIYNRALDTDFKVNIFPNPTSNFINLEMESPNKGAWKITLYNKIGQKVYQASTDENNMVIDTNRPIFTNGLYLVHIQHGDQLISKKIIVAR